MNEMWNNNFDYSNNQISNIVNELYSILTTWTNFTQVGAGLSFSKVYNNNFMDENKLIQLQWDVNVDNDTIYLNDKNQLTVNKNNIISAGTAIEIVDGKINLRYSISGLNVNDNNQLIVTTLWEDVDTSDFVPDSNVAYTIPNYDGVNYIYQIWIAGSFNDGGSIVKSNIGYFKSLPDYFLLDVNQSNIFDTITYSGNLVLWGSTIIDNNVRISMNGTNLPTQYYIHYLKILRIFKKYYIK